MPTLEKAYHALTRTERYSFGVSAISSLGVTIIYLIAVLSVPLEAPQRLIWLAAYPIISSEYIGMGYLKVFIRSLWILPFVIFIGVFNPILDTQKALVIDGIYISHGWITFISIILRGLLSMQALVIVGMSAGMLEIFASLRKLGCPSVLVTQLTLTYRYLTILMEEVISMKRARLSRGFGNKSYPIGMWTQFVGQLLINSSRRATRIHHAMLSRGFDGVMPSSSTIVSNKKSILWCLVWIGVITSLRFIDFSDIIHRVI